MTNSLLKGAALVGTALTLGLLSTTPAHAFTFANKNSVTVGINDVNQSFTSVFTGQTSGGANVPGLSAEAIFTFKGFTSVLNNARTEALFNVKLTNTSSAPITASRVSGLGFNVAPNATGVGNSNNTGDTRVLPNSVNTPNTVGFDDDASRNIPGLGDKEVCFSDNNCAGNGGVNFGQFGNFSFILGFDNPIINSIRTPINSFTLSDFFVRYQSITGSSVVANNGSAEGVGKVPTPALLPGLLALGAGVWRKRKGEQSAEVKTEV